MNLLTCRWTCFNPKDHRETIEDILGVFKLRSKTSLWASVFPVLGNSMECPNDGSGIIHLGGYAQR